MKTLPSLIYGGYVSVCAQIRKIVHLFAIPLLPPNPTLNGPYKYESRTADVVGLDEGRWWGHG